MAKNNPKNKDQFTVLHPFVDGAFILDLQINSFKSISRTREERSKSMKWCERCQAFNSIAKLSLRRDGLDYGSCDKCGLEQWSWRWNSEEL